MPKRLRPIAELDFTGLAPHEVRISTVLELGTGLGRLPDELRVRAEGCQSLPGMPELSELPVER